MNDLSHLNLSGEQFVVLCFTSQCHLANRLSQERLLNFSVTKEQQPLWKAQNTILQTDVGNLHLFLIMSHAKSTTALF